LITKYTEILLNELSGKMAKDYAIGIAKFHREQASPGFHEAALFVKQKLGNIGLDNIVIEQFAADGKTKYWTHKAVVSWRINSGEMWLIEPKKELLARFDESPLSIVTYSQSTDVVAEVIDVGSGDSSQDYKGKDVKGKIVLVTADPRYALKEAIKHGALGLICHPTWERSASYPDLIRYYRLRPNGLKRDEVTFGFSISDRQYQELSKMLNSGKKVRVHCKIDAELYDGFMDILTAQITGTEKPNEEVILIAHLCHAKTCTNDNASGSGTILEIARTIKRLIKEGRIEPPKRTIRFMWVPEINGTVPWMTKHEDELKNTIVSLNLDMVGEHPVTVGRPINLVMAPDSTPSFLNDLLTHLLKEIADNPKGVAVEGWPYGLNYRLEKFAGGSDHLLFADRYFGIPSVMFYNPDQFHHTSYDETSRVDSTKMKRIGIVAATAALTIANADRNTARELAAMTHASGLGRVGNTASRVIKKLIDVSSCPDSRSLSSKLGTVYVRGLKKIEESAKREEAAVLFSNRLSENDPVVNAISQDFSTLAEAEKKKVKALYESVCSEKGIRKVLKERSKEIVNAQRLIPIRNYKGPARSIRPTQVENKEDRKWLSEFNARTNPHYNYTTPIGGPTLELMNFVDGERSIYDIAISLSTEYTDIEPSDVKRYLGLFENRGLIKYVEKDN
jgi:hypothetical protein